MLDTDDFIAIDVASDGGSVDYDSQVIPLALAVGWNGNVR